MSDTLSRELPALKDWQAFERLMFDLFRRLWKTSDAELHGRTGQPQSGVDIYGTNQPEQKRTGVQCKGKDGDLGAALTEQELREEVAKALTFQPPLDVFVIATTAPNDQAIQAIARSVSEEHARVGKFEVRVQGWGTLRQLITDFPDLLGKHFQDFAPVDLLGVAQSGHSDLRQSMDEMKALIRTQSGRIVAESRSAREGDDTLADRVNELGKLVSDGSPLAAIRALERIQNQEGEDASPLARFRILANLGNANFALGREADAIAFFRQAYEAHPDYPSAKAIMATVYLLEDRRADAYEMARSALDDDPESVRAAGTVVDTMDSSATLAEVEASLPEAIRDSGEIKLHFALRARASADESAALRYAREALEREPDDWRMLATLGEELCVPLAQIEGVALTNAMPDELRSSVEEALVLFEKAWAILASRDSSYQGRHVALNLMGLLSLVGREADADRVLDQALQSNSGYAPLQLKLAQRLASKGDWKGSSSSLADIDDADLTFDGFLLRVQSALHLNDAASARDAVEGLLKAADDEDKVQVAEGFEGLVRVREGADLSATVKEIARARPNSIIVRSIFYDWLDNADPLRESLSEEIANIAAGDISIRAKVHAAETLFSAGSFSVAADLYADLHSKADSFALRRHLQALHLADRRKEARSLFESLPKAIKQMGSYASIGVAIYERAGLLRPALALLESRLATRETLRERIGWIQLLARLNRPDNIINWLRTVESDIEGNAEELMTLARLVDHYLGDPKALAIGYRALRLGYSIPEVHLSYAAGLIINGRAAQQGLTPPATIEPGAGVVLTNEATGEALYRLIELSDDPVVERGEVAASDPLAKALLGLSNGDTIELERAGGAQTFRVREVQHRYVFAFQRTLRDFCTLFPNNSAFGSFDIDDSKGDDRFEPMFAMARRRAEFGQQIEDLYRKSTAPLVMLSKFSGSSVFDLWEGLRAGPNGELRVALGNVAEFRRGREAAGEGIAVVDPLSIYSWVRLGIGDILLKCRDRLAVVQSTIDILRGELDERRSHVGRKMGTFGWDGEHYHLVELSPETIDRQIADAVSAASLAEALQLVPAETDVSLEENVAELLEDVHDAFVDTLLASLQAKRSILADDLGFRVIAQGAGALVTWTQAFLQAAAADRIISGADYRNAIDAFVQSRFEFTQLGHLEILAELGEAGWSTNERLRRFASTLVRPNVGQQSVIGLMARLIIDSNVNAPNDEAMAVFPNIFASALSDIGRTDERGPIFEAIFDALEPFLRLAANRYLLPSRLLRTTNMTPPSTLVPEASDYARTQARNLKNRLYAGGLDLHS